MYRECTCCFTGHRRMPEGELDHIKASLDRKLDALIVRGVTSFISGGALGFDGLAASAVIEKKQREKRIHLIFALPCKSHMDLWSASQRAYYYSLLGEADDLIYVSEDYYEECMKKRNRFMVDHSAYCLCALLYRRSGTGQTVRYAVQKGLNIIHVI